MDNYASIGKAVILQTLGLQKNYTEVESEIIEETDYSCIHCKDCKYRTLVDNFEPGSEIYASAVSACNNCPSRLTKEKVIYKKVYHNEKNRYGYKPRLKSNAIKLLLLFHFNTPDRFGIVKNVDIKELSAKLNCNIKTVKSNLDILSEYGYISYCYINKYTISLCLKDYEKYFLPANKGGRGFFVMSYKLLEQILLLDNLLSLRIHLRELLEIDNLNITAPFTAVSKTFREMKLSLPEYCKPSVIRKAINKDDSIFNISFKDNVVRFEIRDAFNSRKQKQDCYNNYIEMFKEFVATFNNEVYIHATTPTFTGIYLNSYIPEDATSLKLLSFNELELEDLASLALTYSYDYVQAALEIVYKTYILPERTINNLGGLLRTIIISLRESNSSSLAA